jgi:hypothetical protein
VVAKKYHRVRRQIFFKRNIRHAISEQTKIANYLNTNYINPYFENKSKKWNIMPKKNFETQKIVWQFWYQGFDENLPPLIRACFASVDKYMSDYQIIRLTKENILEYVDLPDFILQKIDGQQLGLAHFSDLLRLCLLITYGGVWLDAKLLLTNNLPRNWLQSNFFLFQRTELAPTEKKFWQLNDYQYFSWNLKFKVRILNSFIVAQKNYVLLSILKDILFNFWENENDVRHYFLFQIAYNEIISREDCTHLNCPIIGDTNIHLLQYSLLKTWTQQRWEAICAVSPIHKLTYKKFYTQNSIYAKILEMS